jgi:4-phytase/acid phosphatase
LVIAALHKKVSVKLPYRYRVAARWFIAGALWLSATPVHAAAHYQLEKVVELSRHGIRPPTAGNRKDIEAATHRGWTAWTTADGELTGHDYAAVANKGRWQGEHYRRLGLLTSGCPQPQDVYVRASPLQRTRATAQALVDGAFPGCGVAIHRVEGENDPLFQTEAFPATHTDPLKQLNAVQQEAGDLAARQQALQPAVQALKTAVCSKDADCTFFDKPWQIKKSKMGKAYVEGLSVLANMVETLRLGWNENLPLSQLAWGNISSSAQITAVLPLLTANYDLSNDVRYTAQKRGSILLNAMLQGVEQGVNPIADTMPDPRWLLLVAHDTNIAMVRRLMDFTWTLSGYTRGNIPPGSSLVFERWRDSQSGERFLHIYFQAQSLDDLRTLQAVNQAHPLLRAEWRQADCRITDVGTLCPMQSAVKTLGKNVDKQSITPVRYDSP